MKTYLDCIPCFFKQALEAARLAGVDKNKQNAILHELARALPKFSLNSSPPQMGWIIHRLIKVMTHEKDPYIKIKQKSNRLALRIYNKLKKRIEHSNDKLLTALELAIAGNIIDYGVKNSLDVTKELKNILEGTNKAVKNEDKNLFNYSAFKSSLKGADTILYLGDNAGETVFDRLFIEEIKKIYRDKKIFYAVKESPIINDALIEDAYVSGIDTCAEIISSGSDAPGTILSLCSKNFLSRYKKADMVISKGQGNFEALSAAKREVFFLFMAKCPVIARDIGCNVGDVILSHHPGRKRTR